MKKIIALVGLLLAMSIVACSGGATTPAAKSAATPVLVVKASSKIIAEGKVIPATNAALAFQSSGMVAQVLVSQGDKVEAGKVLAQLDTKQLDLQLKQAEATLVSAQAKLDQLKRGANPEDVTAAKQNLISAQTAYDKLLKPDQTELLTLKNNVEKAKAALSQAQAAYDAVGGDSNPMSGMLPQRLQVQSTWLDYQNALNAYNTKLTPQDAQVQAALAAVQTAKSAIAKLTPVPDDLSAAQANVDALRAARDLVQDNLNRTKLIAPFTGTIASVEIHAGEQASPGVEVFRLADFANMQIETTDLTEINIVNVQVGDPVTLTLDAIPGLELTGKVTTIKGFGDNRQGDIVYTVVIKLDKQDERLRWNMTAKVSIGK